MGGMKQRQRGDEQEKENKGMCVFHVMKIQSETLLFV